MIKGGSVKVYYLDASAMIKLVVDENGSAPIRDFFYNHATLCTTSLCMAEALGRIKGMWKKGKGNQAKLSMDEYLTATKKLIGYTQSIVLEHGKIEIDKSSLSDMGTHSKVAQIAKEHNLDLSDALQLYTIKNGKYSILCLDSSTVLITADKDLATAATKMNIPVWNCLTEPKPDWL